MERRKALFVTRFALEGGPGGAPPPEVAAQIRDYAARGFQVIVIADALELFGRKHASKAELLAAARGTRYPDFALPVSDVLVLDNVFDPGPFWDIARRYTLALQSSLLINRAGEYAAAARNAGMLRAEASTHWMVAA